MQAPQRQHNQHGASAVEMALLLPVVLLILFAIFEYSRFFYLESMAAAVSSNAARLASLPGTTDAAVTALVTAELNNAADASPPGFGLGVTPEVALSPPERVAGDSVTVTFRYPFVPMILPQFVGVPLFPDYITAGASAQVEP
ncbi:pilus assembly protein [Desulfovibrio sp. JY]|nr:pilus assembly protein [Desulfovibrio sp. JY]